VVGELPENEAIPAAAFKSVIGGDLVTGRHPTHRPITFTNEAAHLFMSNHLITTKDQTEAFFARWIIVDFPNSRLRSGLPIDPGLAERIIGNELPGIAFWALEGAKRLIANGEFSKSMAHDRLMAKWRRSTSSLSEFIHECCELSPDAHRPPVRVLRRYTQWCGETGRKPFSKAREGAAGTQRRHGRAPGGVERVRSVPRHQAEGRHGIRLTRTWILMSSWSEKVGFRGEGCPRGGNTCPAPGGFPRGHAGAGAAHFPDFPDWLPARARRGPTRRYWACGWAIR
jgi:phage/plasmid-associated DNA primase